MGKDRLLRGQVRKNGKETNKTNDKPEVDNFNYHLAPLFGGNQVMADRCLG